MEARKARKKIKTHKVRKKMQARKARKKIKAHKVRKKLRHVRHVKKERLIRRKGTKARRD